MRRDDYGCGKASTKGDRKATGRAFRGIRRFRFLNREQKRSIMAASRARVFTSGYVVDRVELPILNGCYTDNHFPAAAALPPAHCGETPGVRQEKEHRCAIERLRLDEE